MEDCKFSVIKENVVPDTSVDSKSMYR